MTARTGPRASQSDMATFSISDPLPHGTTLLEASAGTGKTWTIAALVTRWVADGEATLPEMLIVTFGRAASAELRTRVREQLLEAHQALGSEPKAGDNELISLLKSGSAAEIAVRRRRLKSALSDFDSSTIATIHQFCQLVLRNLGVAGDTDPSAELVQDLDDLLTEVVDDIYLRGFVNDDRPPAFEYHEALAIARAVTGDPDARILPEGAAEFSAAARRVKFAEVVRKEFDARKRQRGVLHYNDLLTQLADALEHANSLARQRMRERWKIVLVDEFQDTDPIQWKVFSRAFSGHGSMVLIGDPKQAIYGFRGGDVTTYLEAAQTADRRMTLGTNFRSDQPLVQGLQHILGGAALGDPAIVVRPVAAQHQGKRLDGAPNNAAVRLRVLSSPPAQGSGKPKALSIKAARSTIAEDLASDIAGLLNSGTTFDGRAITPQDIGVLVRTNKEFEAIGKALADLNIPSVIASAANVLLTAAATEWLTVLTALASPHRGSLARSAALTSLMGNDALTLDARIQADPRRLDDELSGELQMLATLVGERGVAALLEYSLINGLTDRVVTRPDGERHLTDLRQVGEMLHHVSHREQLTPAGLATWLAEHMGNDVLASGARVRRLESDDAAVQMASLHASKGLQWPVVYLPSLADRYISDEKLPRFHSEPEHQRSLYVGGKDGPGFSDAHVQYAAEDAGESLRLLYVGFTRAQSQVVAWWAPTGQNTRPAPLHRVLFGRARDTSHIPDKTALPSDRDAWQKLEALAAGGDISVEHAEPAHAPARQLTRSVVPASARSFARALDTQWRRTSYSALSAPADAGPGVGTEAEVAPDDDGLLPDDQGADAVPSDVPPRDELPGPWIPGSEVASPMAGLPVGATFGSLVHAVLEHTDPASPDRHQALLDSIEAQAHFWPAGLAPEQYDELADALEAVYDSPLGPLAGNVSLGSITVADRLAELDFEFPLAGGDSPSAHNGDLLLSDLAPILEEHLAEGDPVREWARTLRGAPWGAQPLRGYLTGSIDVVLRVGETYLVVDYKTNWLGPFDEPLTASAYDPSALAAAMGHSSYPLQAILYAVVAHRFLRGRLRDYEPDRHLGGVLYLYLRGMCGPGTPVIDGHPCGVFSWSPPSAMVLAISDLLDGAQP